MALKQLCPPYSSPHRWLKKRGQVGRMSFPPPPPPGPPLPGPISSPPNAPVSKVSVFNLPFSPLVSFSQQLILEREVHWLDPGTSSSIARGVREELAAKGLPSNGDWVDEFARGVADFKVRRAAVSPKRQRVREEA